jgi:hypothetical protein
MFVGFVNPFIHIVQLFIINIDKLGFKTYLIKNKIRINCKNCCNNNIKVRTRWLIATTINHRKDIKVLNIQGHWWVIKVWK